MIFKDLSKVLVIHLRAQNRKCCFVNDSQEIAILIKSIAKSKKITIKQTLSDCRLSVNTFSMQTGGYYPRIDDIFKIAEVIGTTAQHPHSHSFLFSFHFFDCPEQKLWAAYSFLLEVLVDPFVQVRLDRGSEILVVFRVVAVLHRAGRVRFALGFIFHSRHHPMISPIHPILSALP